MMDRGTIWCSWFGVFSLLQSMVAMISSGGGKNTIYLSDFYVRIYIILKIAKHQ